MSAPLPTPTLGIVDFLISDFGLYTHKTKPEELSTNYCDKQKFSLPKIFKNIFLKRTHFFLILTENFFFFIALREREKGRGREREREGEREINWLPNAHAQS